MRELRVVTHRKWLVDIFRDVMHPEVSSVKQDFGFDIDPATVHEKWWWCPGAWASSAAAAGIHLPLASCGSTWLEQLSWSHLRRSVLTCPVEHAWIIINHLIVSDVWHSDRVFVKLPETKVDWFPAQSFLCNEWLPQSLSQNGMPPNTLVQLSEMTEFVVESRFFVADREIVAGSLYRVGDVIWGADDFDRATYNDNLYDITARMLMFAERLVGDPSVRQPRGWVLDVGLTSDDQIAVVEANAAWSSGPYDCEPSGVLKALIASQSERDGVESEWQWRPSDTLRASGPLRLSTDV